jgi:hypothetical protein
MGSKMMKKMEQKLEQKKKMLANKGIKKRKKMKSFKTNRR